MKKLMLALATASVLSSGAFAQTVATDSVNLEITGKISDAPCKVEIADKEKTMTFDGLTLADFTGVGTETAQKQAVINFTGCNLGSGATPIASKVEINAKGNKAPGSDIYWNAGAGVDGVGIALEIDGKKLPPSGLTTPHEIDNLGDQSQAIVKASIIQTKATVKAGDINQTIKFDVVYK